MRSSDFSTVTASHTPVWPASNTGQKSLAAPLIDWLTASFPESALRLDGHDLEGFIFDLFQFQTKAVMTEVQLKTWNWCAYSAQIIDQDNNSLGKVGIREDGSFLVSLSGHGCQFVKDWQHVVDTLNDTKGHISRVDIAVDDLEGSRFSVDTFKTAWQNGEFTMNGRPPEARFIDDMGSGKGCTLYIGKKGHKELCIYEKGKQLGDLASNHTRCELRLFANKIELSNDVLVNPAPYFAAAYPLLAEFIAGEIGRLEVKQRCVDATAAGLVRFLRTQGGKAINLVFDALGDEASEYIVANICRDGRPGRFKAVSGDLVQYFRTSIKDKQHVAHQN